MNTPSRTTLLAATVAAVFLIPSAAVRAAAPPAPQGFITARDYYNLNTGNGVALSGLTNNAKFPDAPDFVDYPTLFEVHPDADPTQTPAGDPLGLSDYGSQLIGYFYPDTTGPYTFYICSDDLSVLYLSTDDSPANKHLIAAETGWSSARQYDTSVGGSDLTAKRSDQYKGTQWPTKNPDGTANVTLTQGKAYYIEALFKEGGGGDNLSVSLDALAPIPGTRLSSFDRASATAPFVSSFTGHGGGFYFQIKETTGGSQVNFSSAQLKFDGVSVTPTVTRVIDRVVVAYLTPAPLTAGSAHTAVLTFADNATPPLTQSSTHQYTVGPYSTVPAGYALSSAATDPGMKAQVYQIDFVRAPGNSDSIANAEQQWARGFIDPNTGQPYPNVANAQAQAGPINVASINWNGAMDPGWPDTDLGVEIGDFQSTNNPPMNILDVPIPGIPGTGSDPSSGTDGGRAVDNIVAELETYLHLAPGFYRMGVNSDDGFKVTVAPGVPNPFGLVLGSFDGVRGSSDSLFDFVATADGYYPFRLLWWQGDGGANLEWFVVDLATGNKYLVNQNDPKAVTAFRTGTGRAYVQSVLPADGWGGVTTNANEKLKIVLQDARTTVVAGSIVLQIDGAAVTPTINRSGLTTTVTQNAPAGGYAWGSTHTGTLIWGESTSPQTMWTNNFSFSVISQTPDDLPANSFWIEAEDFNATGTPVPASVSTMPYDVGVSMPYDTIGATWNVDYNNNDSHENTNPTTYRSTGDPDTDGRSIDLTTSTGGRFAERRPGGFDMTSNYRIGWVDNGEWYNYTRTIPPGVYTAFAALSYGATAGTVPHALAGKLSIVTSGVGTTTQTLQDLGTFDAPASGAWGDNDLVPMKGADGTEGVFKLSGTAATTLRFTTGSGDYDWFVLVPVTGIPAKLQSVDPDGLHFPVSRDAVIKWTFVDFSTTFNTASAKLKINGADVVAPQFTVTKTGDVTTATYDPPGLFEIGKAYSYELTWADSGGTSHTNSGSFLAHYMPGSPANMFLIEDEDFNTGGGQVQAAANTMPYLGGAYNGLAAVPNIDYARPANEPSGDIYRTNEVPNVPMSAQNDANGTVRATDATGTPTWTLTTNYRLGWADSGNWYNYTRQIPAGNYQVWASMSFGEAPSAALQLRGNLSQVTSDPTKANQTIASVGYFRAPATGGWGANRLVPLRTTATDASGDAAVVSLGGATPTTLRFEDESGDADYIILVSTGPSFRFNPPTISGNGVNLSWLGTAALLQEASNLTGSPSDWSNIATNPASPVTLPIGTAARKFYRLQQ